MPRLVQKNMVVAALGLLLCYAFWLSRPLWNPEMRFWRAVGDGSLLLLFVALSLGPLAKLWPRGVKRWLPYRREFGVWFGLLALLHTVLVLSISIVNLRDASR